MISREVYARCVSEALRALGVRRLVLAIHDASFPSAEDDDTGRGSPCSRAGVRFLRFARELGFNGIQFGPQGETREDSASPYDGTIFSRNTLSISLSRLADAEGPWSGLLRPDRLHSIVEARPEGARTRVPYGYVYREHREALREAFSALRARHPETASEPALLPERFAVFERESAPWLERDSLYQALRHEYPGVAWRRWRDPALGELDRRLWNPGPAELIACQRRRQQLEAKRRSEIELYRFCQFAAHEQHRLLRDEIRDTRLRLYGDLQIGLSQQDAWSYQALMLPDYVMGAPPSRTNPGGQPWHYGVLDPDQYGDAERPGPVLRLVRSRMAKMFAEFDAVRIDHPHGLVCPWVYRTDDEDAGRAVRRGARLFSSPDLPDHPGLARWTIVRREQLNPDPSTPRHADDWVVGLAPDQMDRYARLFDAVVASAHENGRETSDLVCEVLSTMPYPLQRVLERYGLGRFRVTQKADLHDPAEVYRSENAKPADWIMVGNHDTTPIWRLIAEWDRNGQVRQRAQYLAERLRPARDEREAFAAQLTGDGGLLAQAQFADLFASRAQNVMIFFSDLFGLTEPYNTPGTLSEENWSLRLPPTYRRDYFERVARNRALNLPLCLALALRGTGTGAARGQPDLLRALEQQAEALRRGSP